MYASINLFKSLTLAMLILLGVCSSSYSAYLSGDIEAPTTQATG